MKQFFIFVGGVVTGAYAMYNKLYKQAAEATIERLEKQTESEEETEE